MTVEPWKVGDRVGCLGTSEPGTEHGFICVKGGIPGKWRYWRNPPGPELCTGGIVPGNHFPKNKSLVK